MRRSSATASSFRVMWKGVRAIRESIQQNGDRAGQRLTEKNLCIQPTITIRPGWPLPTVVQRDIVLRPYKG